MPVLRRCQRCDLLLSWFLLLLVDGFHELAYHERYTLDALDLLLCSHELAFETSVARLVLLTHIAVMHVV